MDRLIELKPELSDSDELIRFLHVYEENIGVYSSNDKKLRLVHSTSEIRTLATEIYQVYLKTKGLSYWGDLHDFCSNATYGLEEISTRRL